MAVSASTYTATPYLNAIPVAQQFSNQVKMDIGMIERDNTKPVCLLITQYANSRYGVQSIHYLPGEHFLVLKYTLHAHFFLQFNGKASSDRLQKSRCTAIFACFNIVDILVLPPGIGPVHRTTSRIIRNI